MLVPGKPPLFMTNWEGNVLVSPPTVGGLVLTPASASQPANSCTTTPSLTSHLVFRAFLHHRYSPLLAYSILCVPLNDQNEHSLIRVLGTMLHPSTGLLESEVSH